MGSSHYVCVHSSTTNTDPHLVPLPSENMTSTFDLDVVQPLNDFKTDDSELFHSENMNQVITKTADQSLTQCSPLFSPSSLYMDI